MTIYAFIFFVFIPNDIHVIQYPKTAAPPPHPLPPALLKPDKLYISFKVSPPPPPPFTLKYLLANEKIPRVEISPT